MSTSNVELLSRGLRTYQKKRRAAGKRPDEVTFDHEKRREYLTGFHKRKEERRNLAVQRAKEREKKQRCESRKAYREEMAKAAEAKVAAYRAYMEATETGLGDDVDERDSPDISGEDPDKPKAAVSEFKTSELLTTVTVEEMGEEEGFGFGVQQIPSARPQTVRHPSKRIEIATPPPKLQRPKPPRLPSTGIWH